MKEAGRLPSDELSDHPPFAPKVFRQNSDHPLHGAQDRSVDDHRPVLVIAVLPANTRRRRMEIGLN